MFRHFLGGILHQPEIDNLDYLLTQIIELNQTIIIFTLIAFGISLLL